MKCTFPLNWRCYRQEKGSYNPQIQSLKSFLLWVHRYSECCLPLPGRGEGRLLKVPGAAPLILFGTFDWKEGSPSLTVEWEAVDQLLKKIFPCFLMVRVSAVASLHHRPLTLCFCQVTALSTSTCLGRAEPNGFHSKLFEILISPVLLCQMLPLFLIKKPPEIVYIEVEKLAFYRLPSSWFKSVKNVLPNGCFEQKWTVGTY